MSEQILDRQLLEPPAAGTELETLLGTLERNRRTFAWKCWVATADGRPDATAMARTVGTSAMTIGGLLRHLTRVEVDTVDWKLRGWVRTGRAGDRERDWDFDADDDAQSVWRAWCGAVERSRTAVAEALADGGLGRADGTYFSGYGTPSLRRLIADLIEEYARHTGHADLIRESIDGLVGEDAPANVLV